MGVYHECEGNYEALQTIQSTTKIIYHYEEALTCSRPTVLADAIRLANALIRSGSTGSTASPVFRRICIIRSPMTRPPDSLSAGFKSRAIRIKTRVSPVCPVLSDHESSCAGSLRTISVNRTIPFCGYINDGTGSRW